MGCIYSRACVGEICSTKDAKIRENEKITATEIAVFSTDNSDGELGDQLSHLGLTRDTELGITRLSRVSSQFLPPEGSRKVKIPSGNYELCYSYLSQRGYYPDDLYKANQDSFCIHSPFGTNPNDHFFGVFDGHGESGAECSQFVKQKLCENLLRSSRFHIDTVEACHSAFCLTNSQLHADNLDDSMSGTTAITVLVRGKALYAANSGDSRAVIAERRGKDLIAVDLSMDHTPFRLDELERVKLCGARVLTLDQIEGLKDPDLQCWGTEERDDGDPPRLWVQNGMYPGTAFTRSIGDSIAETIGVVADPEIVALELTQDHPFFVIASDGVFEFMTSQSVVDMVAKYKDPRDACAAIVAESYRLWLQYETRTDDITVIVVHINGLSDTDDKAESLGGIMRSPIPQLVEATGSESPSTLNWTSSINRARKDLSRARLRVLESSLGNGQVWVPPSPSHRKTWEEEAHIQRVLHDHFLFRKLTDSQSHVLLDCMQRVEVQAGEIVVKQGGEGECFYVVGSGELEVLATQEEKDGGVPRILQRYTAEKLSSFGELALMYNKPLQASVRAVTSVTLWALRREDFRGILMSEFSNLSSLKLLRSVDLLSRLTISQLSQISDSLLEVSFCNGQTIANRDLALLGLYILQKGRVRITFDSEVIHKPNTGSLVPDYQKQDKYLLTGKEITVEKTEGSYFGEWMLIGQQIGLISAVAECDVACAVLTKEKFDSVIGPLTKLSQDNHEDYSLGLPKEPKGINFSSFRKVELSELDWKKSLYSTDCCEIGLVRLKDSENLLSLKRFSKHKIRCLNKEAMVLKEKNLMKSLRHSGFVPTVLCTCADQTYAGILLDTGIACPISSILHSPLDEESARFFAASLVTALEDLHQNGVLYRGVTPDVMLDQTGYIQLVDFRFAKKMSGERSFTICGPANFLAPEIVQGRGHSFPADWWALGVLIYFMLLGEMPFESSRENAVFSFVKIVNCPQTLSSEAVDLITKLLEVDENTRLGTKGGESVKTHPWFNGVNWKGLRDRSSPVPREILSRVTQCFERHSEENGASLFSPPRSVDGLNSPEWLEDW